MSSWLLCSGICAPYVNEINNRMWNGKMEAILVLQWQRRLECVRNQRWRSGRSQLTTHFWSLLATASLSSSRTRMLSTWCPPPPNPPQTQACSFWGGGGVQALERVAHLRETPLPPHPLLVSVLPNLSGVVSPGKSSSGRHRLVKHSFHRQEWT